MTYKGMMKVNGVWIPSPATLDVSTEDLDVEAFRTTDGLMHRQRAGKKLKLICTWDIVPDTQEYYSFFSLLDNLPEFFPVQFPHPSGNNAFVITAYRGNPLSASMRSYWDERGKKVSRWKATKANFIEQ